jgi:hypothetical protein
MDAQQLGMEEPMSVIDETGKRIETPWAPS